MSRHSGGSCVLLSIQHRSFSGKTGVCAASEDESELSFLCRVVQSDEHLLKVSTMCGKAVQRQTNFHANMRSEGGGKALTCPGEHPSLGSAIHWEELGL